MTDYKSIKYNISGADLTNIPTSAITTGTMASARISEASVTQHVTATDLTPVRQDVTTLALKQAVNENKAAFNLPNSFIDQFEDDTGLNTQTDVDRNTTDEYVASVSSVPDTDTKLYLNWDTTATAMEGADSDSYTVAQGYTSGAGSSLNTANKKFGASSLYIPQYSHFVITPASGDLFGDAQSGDWTIEYWFKMTTRAAQGVLMVKGSHSYNDLDFRMFLQNTSGTTQTLSGASEHATTGGEFTSSALADTSAWNHYVLTRDGDTCRAYVNGVQVGSYAVSGTLDDDFATIQLSQSQIGAAQGYCNGYWDDLRFSSTCRYPDGTGFTPHTTAHGSTITTVSATGTLIGTANVPSAAQTKVSGVALYKDNEGTATIGTDLKIYFTCNGGTNWTEVPTYTAVTPLFSTGVKMLKLAETTCTTGSDVRYKAVWANQALSSKETQLHGIGINY